MKDYKDILKDHKSTIFVFIVGFFLLFMYNRFFSFMDEADNMLGALSVIHGGDIYKEFISQHTPFSYYFASVFALLGARDYAVFRFYMNITILLIWIFMYLRYSKHFGTLTMKMIIIAYSLSINFTWGHMLLSDVFSGYALLFLVLEAIIFTEKKVLNMTNMVIISLCIFTSVMSAFVSIYPIFILLFPLAIIEFYRMITKKSEGNIKIYIKLILVVSIPFLILGIWYLISGNLSNFYAQAYQFNRGVYSNYIGGLGNDPIGVFKSTLVAWFNHLVNVLSNFTKENLINTLLVIFNLLFIYIYYKKQRGTAIVLFFFIAFTGVRGYTDFHAIPYYLFSFFSMAYVINNALKNKSNNDFVYNKTILKILVALFFVFSINNYLPNAGLYLFKPNKEMVMASTSYNYYIQTLTAKDDKIWAANLHQIYIDNKRESAVRSVVLLPWFLDAYEKEIFEDLEKNRPKLIIIERDAVIWGRYKYSEFAKVVFDYLDKEYTCLNENDIYEKNVYIRNDYYEEASKLLYSKVTGINDGMLISNNSNIYLIENNKKRYITSLDLFNSLGFKLGDVIPVEDDIFKKIKTGEPMD